MKNFPKSYNLPEGYALFQESENRLCTTFGVVECFVKTANKVAAHLIQLMRVHLNLLEVEVPGCYDVLCRSHCHHGMFWVIMDDENHYEM